MSYQPKTGARCSCKLGTHRDNCPQCEGTGWVIDFAAIRARAADDFYAGRQADADAARGSECGPHCGWCNSCS